MTEAANWFHRGGVTDTNADFHNELIWEAGKPAKEKCGYAAVAEPSRAMKLGPCATGMS